MPGPLRSFIMLPFPYLTFCWFWSISLKNIITQTARNPDLSQFYQPFSLGFQLGEFAELWLINAEPFRVSMDLGRGDRGLEFNYRHKLRGDWGVSYFGREPDIVWRLPVGGKQGGGVRGLKEDGIKRPEQGRRYTEVGTIQLRFVKGMVYRRCVCVARAQWLEDSNPFPW